MLPAVINPATVQLMGTVVVTLIETGKLVAHEIAPFVRKIFGRDHVDLTEDELNAIAADVEARAEVREALSRVEAGQ